MMEEIKTNRIEVSIKNKYLLTIRKEDTYFGLESKYMCRMAEADEDWFTIMIGNKYMIVRSILEKYFKEATSNINCTTRLDDFDNIEWTEFV